MSNLPNGWATTTLDKVAEWGSGGTPSRKNPKFYDGTIPWIKTGELGSKYIKGSSEHISEDAVRKSSAKIFPVGSVGIAMYGATIGKTSIFGIEASTNQACAVAQPHEHALDHEFLYYFLRSEKQSFIDAGKGGAQPNISQGVLKEWLIELPPLNEQKRIVAKIEQLFSELDKGVEALKAAKAQLKLYRQALLKHAFEGNLTADWREANKDKLETAEALLTRIKTERESRYQQQLDDWKQAVKKWGAGRKEGKKPVKPKPPQVQSSMVQNDQKDLPHGWEWFCVSELCDVVRGGSPRPAGDKRYYDGDIPFLKVADITRSSSAYLDKFSYTIKKLGLQKTRFVNANTLMISNSGATLGVPKICLIEATFNDGIAAFLGLNESLLLYHYYFWQSKTLSLRNINQGAAQPNLNTNIIGETCIPICSQQEMLCLVEELETNLSTVGQMEIDIEAQLKKSETLRQSILKKAFSGKLVPQDPSDEPASKLLERIKAEKAAQAAANKPTKKKTRRKAS
ncbi:Type I restriction-modification system, specificity subunit S [hydrothermal vent metagenome]|uniref:Type I restriction-modification system, specificity subunit S n=1 Tax=hydrothermal vent metagenome TaxID=652676 RepID=A0A3B1AFA8_9ZZZZ